MSSGWEISIPRFVERPRLTREQTDRGRLNNKEITKTDRHYFLFVRCFDIDIALFILFILTFVNVFNI